MLSDFKTQLDKLYKDSEKEFFNIITSKLKEWNFKYFYIIMGPDEYCDGMSKGINDYIMTDLEIGDIVDEDYPYEFNLDAKGWDADQTMEMVNLLSGTEELYSGWENLWGSSILRITQDGKVTTAMDIDE